LNFPIGYTNFYCSFLWDKITPNVILSLDKYISCYGMIDSIVIMS
jgi:hypothetical protein